MARRAEDPGTTQRDLAGGGAPRPDRRDRAGEPSPATPPARKAGRGELRDPLGDFAEQVGAFFG